MFTYSLHLIWNVVVTQIVYAFQLVERKVMKEKIKSSWHSEKITFATTGCKSNTSASRSYSRLAGKMAAKIHKIQ